MTLIAWICACLMLGSLVCAELGFLVWIFGLYMWKQIENLMFLPKWAALAWAKILETHCCLCANCRLGKLVSLERETFSSKRDNLAWARIRSDFELPSAWSLAQARMIRLSEIALSSGRDLLAWARTTTAECLILCFNGWSYMYECINVKLAYNMLGLLWLVTCMVDLHEFGLWEDVVELEFQGKFQRVCFSVCTNIRTHYWGILKLQ